MILIQFVGFGVGINRSRLMASPLHGSSEWISMQRNCVGGGRGHSITNGNQMDAITLTEATAGKDCIS